MQQVKDSPGVDTDLRCRDRWSPIPTITMLEPYWSSGLYMAVTPGGRRNVAGTLRRVLNRAEEIAAKEREDEDLHLRSAKAVTGYHIHACDGEIGHVADFLVKMPTGAFTISSSTPEIGGPERRFLFRALDQGDRLGEPTGKIERRSATGQGRANL